MDRHYTPASLERLLLDPASDEVLDGAVQHLWRCDRCWTAAAAVANMRRTDLPTHPSGSRSVLLSLVQGEERSTLVKLKAKGLWSELRELSPGEQTKRIRSVTSLQSVSLFEVVVAEAWRSTPLDHHVAEQTAYLAFTLAGLLPAHRVSFQVRRDMEGEALTIVANCRRLLADWVGSSQAIKEAERHLAEGTGDPEREAMLLSIHSFLASDTGNFEIALGYSSRALELYRQIGDWVAVARTAIVEAGTLLASGQVEDAIVKANLALGLLGPEESRLELLARGIIIESYVILGRSLEALHLFSRAAPLFERPADSSTRLRVRFLEARLLDGLGNVREAEKLFKDVYQAFIDMESYKDAFVTLMTLFESQCQRGALDKAARLCQTAIEGTHQMGTASNTQIRETWQKLLLAIQVGQLQKADVEDARQFFVRYWNIPPKGGIRSLPQVRKPVRPTVELSSPIPSRPAVPAAINPSSYKEARDTYDRELVFAALRETGGSLSEASRRLGLSRMTLRAKLRQYGLTRPE
jgi:tetratricopeptide (TPR) repeat protein